MLLRQVQTEVHKKWQHYRVVRFAGFGRRLVSTMTSYAAVPPNDGVGQAAPQHTQLNTEPEWHHHGQQVTQLGVQHDQLNTEPEWHHHGQQVTQLGVYVLDQLNTEHNSVAPAAATRRTVLQPPNNTAQADVIDDTVTSWLPDDARHGCHGYGDVIEGDDDSQQEQHGRNALRMTRLDVDRR